MQRLGRAGRKLAVLFAISALVTFAVPRSDAIAGKASTDLGTSVDEGAAPAAGPDKDSQNRPKFQQETRGGAPIPGHYRITLCKGGDVENWRPPNTGGAGVEAKGFQYDTPQGQRAGYVRPQESGNIDIVTSRPGTVVVRYKVGDQDIQLRITVVDCRGGRPVVRTDPVRPLIPEPPRIWDGFFLGGGGGLQTTDCNNWDTKRVESLGVDDPLGADHKACFSSAFRASIYAGYNVQVSAALVAGVEWDLGFSTADKTNRGIPGTAGVIVPPALAVNDSVRVRETWDTSVRGRFGVLVTPSVLAYGTAGVALQHIEATVTCGAGICGVNPIAPFSATNSKTVAGWTAGGGVDAMVAGNLILRAEYRYSQYETFTATYGTRATLGITSDIDLRTHTALVGIAVKFGPPTPLPPPLIRK